MKYGIDDRPGALPMLLYGLQWWVASLPCVVIMGLIVAKLQGAGPAAQLLDMQKLFALMGAVTILQALKGHRLPLVVGPASTLLVGMAASLSSGPEAVYTAALCCGAVLTLGAWSGLLSRLRFFFTPRIVAVILVLIAFTLAPTILRLIFGDAGTEGGGQGGRPGAQLCFAACAVLFLVLCNTYLPGMAKSLTVGIGAAVGSLAHILIFGLTPLPEAAPGASPPSLFLNSLVFEPGVILSFVFCFLALTINELGSIESVGQMLQAEDMPGRVRRGSALTGAANVAAGGLGIIGPVDFSLSAGIIAATGCASRYTLIPAGIGLVLCALFPRVVELLCAMPAPVLGALMLYLMSAQLASGLSMLVSEKSITNFNSGLTVGLPLMAGLLISFTPGAAFAEMPGFLRPILGNGFVVGTITVILLEHVLFRKKTQERST